MESVTDKFSELEGSLESIWSNPSHFSDEEPAAQRWEITSLKSQLPLETQIEEAPNDGRRYILSITYHCCMFRALYIAFTFDKEYLPSQR